MELLAPIVAVTVHPRRARITGRGRVSLSGGPAELVVTGLPVSLLEDSVRVAGRSDSPVRVLGVDLTRRELVDAPDARVGAAEETLRAAERALGDVEAVDVGDAAREEMLTRLARRGGDRLAIALAEGTAGVARVAEIGAAVAAQLVAVAQTRRATAERRDAAQRAVDSAQAELDLLHSSGRQRREAVIGVEADGDGEVELELSYVVDGASWSPASQTSVPELNPWWIDVRPLVPSATPASMPSMEAVAAAMAAGIGGVASAPAPERRARKPVHPVTAEPVDATVSASWRLARPTAVPGDGTPHRSTISTFALPARLDHVTAPASSPVVHLRATITNSGGRVLLAGPVSTFLGDAFVGGTVIEQTAPGAEIELAMGVDDRVAVERELIERTAHRARFGTNRGAVERWTITVTNWRDEPVRVLVRDRLPVSRHADVKVVDVALVPEPTERDDLGRVEWAARIEPGQKWEASVRFGVEHPEELPVQGWR